jgi:hypothetical protein
MQDVCDGGGFRRPGGVGQLGESNAGETLWNISMLEFMFSSDESGRFFVKDGFLTMAVGKT